METSMNISSQTAKPLALNFLSATTSIAVNNIAVGPSSTIAVEE